LRPLPFVAVLVTASACFLPGDPAGRMLLSIELSTTHVQADSGVVVRLEARNASFQTIRFTPCGELLDYYLISPDGERIVNHGGCVDSGRDTVEVAPGETLVRELTWYPTPRRENFTLMRFAPGRYQMVGVLQGVEGGIARETEPVSFDLVCRDASWTEC
jgi:hypothetical protein